MPETRVRRPTAYFFGVIENGYGDICACWQYPVTVLLIDGGKAAWTPNLCARENTIPSERKIHMRTSGTMRFFAILLALLVLRWLPTAAIAADGASRQDITAAYTATGSYMEKLGTPGVGSVGGEWMVIGLLRSGRTVEDAYYQSVVEYTRKNIDGNQRLHSVKATENARVILALTAMGKDVTNVDGHDLLQGLSDLSFVVKQGINGPIWTLIALDSGNYSLSAGDVTRERLLEQLLAAQTADGGWTFMGSQADVDMTGMALQALAPYCDTNADVKKAVDTALVTLSQMQNEDGSFTTSAAGSEVTASESSAQVIVALTALGIDPHTDPRFVKNGNSAVDGLLSFFVEGGGFRHMADSDGADGMATEQGFYALTAYSRFVEGKTSLYDMTDVPIVPAEDRNACGIWWVAIPVVILLGGTALWCRNTRKGKRGTETSR